MISINVVCGNSSVDDEDRHRAIEAANRVIEASSYTEDECRDAYMRQWLEHDSETLMTGPALVWIAAGLAADLALTVGWHNPEGGLCYIT